MSNLQSISHTARNYAIPLLVLALGVGGLWGLSSLRNPPETQAQAKKAPLVDTDPITQHPGGITLEANGEVTAYRVIALSAEVAGRIVTKAPECHAGRYVSRGMVLLQIDPSDYELDVKRLGQMVDQAQAMIDELKVEQSNAESLVRLAEEDLQLQRNELRRVQSLAQRNVTSESEVDAARRSELGARNTLQTLQNRSRLLASRRIRLLRDKEQTEVESERAQRDLARTTIRSPVDGVVMEHTVEQDAYVGKGTLLVRIEDTSKVEVRFFLQLEQLQWLWATGTQVSDPTEPADGRSYALPHVPITVALDVGGQEVHWKGHLERYDNAGIDPMTRTVPCIAVVDDPRGAVLVEPHADHLPGSPGQKTAPPVLLRGMFVTLHIHIPLDVPLLVVPASALKSGDVLWIAKDDHLRIRTVHVVHANGDTVLVRADTPDLGVGAQVVVSPLPLAIDGMPIRLRRPTDRPTVSREKLTAESAP